MSDVSPETRLGTDLDAWDRAGLRRTLDPPSGIDFCSNDYLALARDPRVVEAARGALATWGVGATAARLLRGHLPPHERAEHLAASWLHSEAALLFPSGWHANLALLRVVADVGDVILSDRLNHASLIDASRMSRARISVFSHNDCDDLAARLRACRTAKRRLVVVESVFSMDGDLAPLARYLELADEHDAWLVVDEAHGAGLYGPTGAGRCEMLADHPRLLARTVTGGKALGVSGAFVAASRTLVDALIQWGRTFVFTTAPAPSTAAALARAIEICRSEPERRQRAHRAARMLRDAVSESGIHAGAEGAIVPILVGDAGRAVSIAGELRDRGFDVRAIRPPTVPNGTSRLRIVCHADHTDRQLTELARAIVSVVPPNPDAPVVRGPAVQPLVVAGTDTGVGKTVVSALLLRACARRGLDPHYLKPVQTGEDSDTGTVRRLSGLSAGCAPEPIVSLALPASVDQAARAEGVELSLSDILTPCLDRLRARDRSSWVLECAGGLLVPINDSEDQADLLERLGAPLVLVARSGLGTLNHTRLTVEAATRRGLKLRALFVVGEPHPRNVATLRTWLPGLPIFELPPLAPLGVEAIDHWLDRNDVTEVFM